MKEDVRTLIAELNRLIEAGEVSRKEVLSELKGKKGRPPKKPITWALISFPVNGDCSGAIVDVSHLTQEQAEIGELSHQLANQHLFGKPKVRYNERIAKIQRRFQNTQTGECISKSYIDKCHQDYQAYWDFSHKKDKA